MAEDSGRHDHFGMVTALENLQIGAAGERGFDADADLAGFEGRRRDFFNLDSFPAVQDGGFHPGNLPAPVDWRKLVLRRLTGRDDDPRHRIFKMRRILDCGGKRRGTPLSPPARQIHREETRFHPQGGVAAGALPPQSKTAKGLCCISRLELRLQFELKRSAVSATGAEA